VNYYLVKHGYAHASMYPPDVACSSYLASAEEEATSNKIGFWSAVFTPPTQTPEPTVDPREGCDPCYPTVCIPDVSYDLDCGEIAYKRFSVTCDPHGFDGDNDGIGCEK
jgi:micrococcal nuclease